MSESNEKKTNEFWAAYGLQQPVPLAVARHICEQSLRMPQGVMIPFLISVTAQGKTAMIHQLARQEGYRVITLSMVGLEPTDLTGLPFFAKDAKTFHYVPDGRFPIHEDNEKVILFLDEVNRTEQNTINALFQLLNGYIGPNPLGPGVRIVLAANPADSTYAVAGQVTSDPALVRRCTIVPVQRTHLELLDFARHPEKYGLPPEATWNKNVIAFLASNSSLIHEDAREDSGEVFATAAGWERVSHLLNHYESLQDELGTEGRGVREAVLDTAIAGSVGADTGFKFLQYYRNRDAHIPPEEIVLNTKPGSPSYLTIEKMSAEGRGNNLIDTLSGAVDYIALNRPDPQVIAASLSHIMTVVDEHTWEAFLEMLRNAARTPGYVQSGFSPRYLSQLRKAQNDHPISQAWMEKTGATARTFNAEFNNVAADAERAKARHKSA